MLRPPTWAALAAALTLALWPCEARAEGDGGPYFYQARPYGTQSLYSPLWVFLNRGFDVLQTRTDRRAVFGQSYGLDARNVADNLFVHPFSSVRDEGTEKFLREEILPLSYARGTARWVPNYTLHLIGGGATFAALREWSRAQGVAEPWGAVIAGATILSAAFVNETIENGGVVGRNTDAIADFWVFDVGGMLLFSIDGVKRFFSHTLIVSDWSDQPSFTLPSGQLHDVGNHFVAKLPVPYFERLRLFAHYGLGTMGGLSYLLGDGYSVSAAAGSKVTRLTNTDTSAVANTISFVPSAGLFVDRYESLLGSLRVADVPDYTVQLNVYPNAFVRTDPGVGMFGVVGKTGSVAAGVTLTRTFGVGVGYSGL